MENFKYIVCIYIGMYYIQLCNLRGIITRVLFCTLYRNSFAIVFYTLQ